MRTVPSIASVGRSSWRQLREDVVAAYATVSDYRIDVPKRVLVAGYIGVTGFLLSLGIVTQMLLAVEVDDVGVIGPLSGLFPVLMLLSIGYWLPQSELDEDDILTVAKWGGVGIGVLTLVNTSIIAVHRFVTPLFTPKLTMMISNVAIGGVVGLAFGWMRKLDRKARARYQKSTVLNRTLRHDLRNDVNVMLGHIAAIEDDLPEGDGRRIDGLRRKAEDLQKLGERARQIQAAIDGMETDHDPIEVTSIIRREIDAIEDQYRDAEVRVSLPETAWVRADDHVDVAIANVIENAVEHNDGPETRVRVSVVNSPATDTVDITVEDNGPGLPEHERAVLARGEESQLTHSSGTGLWLVRWLVDSYGGTLSFEETTPTGTAVRITLPEGFPEADGGGVSPLSTPGAALYFP